MSNTITTHNADGKAVFCETVPAPRHKIEAPWGTMEIFYTSYSFKPDLSSESDIDKYAQDREKGLPPGTVSPPEGAAASVITLKPNVQSPMHRTITLDYLYIVDSVVELHLDSGEMKTVKAGDTVVQRGTMHMWKNVTPNGGSAKITGFCSCYCCAAGDWWEGAGRRMAVLNCEDLMRTDQRRG